MKKRDKIISFRRQSKDRFSRENLWFLNEESLHNPSYGSGKKVNMEGSSMGIEENYDPFMTKNSEMIKLKKECLFVVDWQLSDSF